MILRHDADVAIIGGGIAGQSLAAALGKSLRVMLLEGQSTLGHHSTSRSTSRMQPSYGPRDVRALTAASLTLMPGTEKTLGTSILSPRALLWCGLAGSNLRADSVAEVPDASIRSPIWTWVSPAARGRGSARSPPTVCPARARYGCRVCATDSESLCRVTLSPIRLPPKLGNALCLQPTYVRKVSLSAI